MPRGCDAVIVIPTLDPIRAAYVAKEARDRAGIPCGLVIASDFAKRGAVRVSNVLVRAAIDWDAKYVCYLNDDVGDFPDGWLKRLIEAVELKDVYGSASAGGKCRGGPQASCRPGMPPGVLEAELPLAWFCTVIKRRVFEQIGYFDERMIHYCDETDFETRMSEQGWLNIYVQDVWVRHDAGQPIREWWDRDHTMLRKKWGHDKRFF